MSTLRLGHSPDPDDAFMWWPLADFATPDGTRHTPRIDTRGYRFVHVLEDIESLNQRSARGELEVTALSIHQLPYIADRYTLTSCGGSMGEGYGPMIIARDNINLRDLITPVTTPEHHDAQHPAPTLAIPGERTTAWLALQLMLLEEEGVEVEGDLAKRGPNRSLDYRIVPFDQIIDRVKEGEFTAGLIIHEGQLTYEQSGLHLVADLGQWWRETRGLPLPLGGNAIRKDVADPRTVTRVLRDSIDYALSHRDQAVAFAMNYARDLDTAKADRFVGMYVNDRTLDYGEEGRRAITQLLEEGAAADILPRIQGGIQFIDPA